MSYDDWPDNTMDNRRAVVRKTIRPATLDELKQLGVERFAIVTDQCCEPFNALLSEHSDGKFYLADMPEEAEIAHCCDANQGIWFLPGIGNIQPKGLQALAEFLDTL